MTFTRRLHEGIRRGEITCSVRIWKQPRVKAGGRYALGPGEIEVTEIERIELSDVTPALARASGFAGVVDLLKVAKHGAGEKVYLIRFRYRPSRRASAGGARPSPRRPGRTTRARSPRG